jgi:hypothetical protein
MDPTPTPASERSELMAGFGWAWATLIGSIVLAVAVGFALSAASGSGEGAFLAGTLPPMAMLGLLASLYFSGRKRQALGVLAAFGTMFAVVLLGVAACFGIAGVSSF